MRDKLRPISPSALGRYGLWMDQALDAEPDMAVEPLAGQQRADFCVIGGGLCGLWTALEIKRRAPNSAVMVLERDLCGAGASGRNGGFALSWWPKIEALIARVGPSEALRLAQLSERAIAELGELCRATGIAAEFRAGGWLWTATSPAQVDAWRGALHACAALGVEPFTELSGRELRARLGSPVHLGGVLERSGATIHPGHLVRGLRRLACERGVRVYEHSAVISLDRDTGLVRTARGALRAGAIVLATNAWLARLRELRRALVAISSDIVATAAMPAALAASGWIGAEAVSDARLLVHYYRTTADGRVIFGRGGGALAFAGRVGAGFDYDYRRAREVAGELRRLVPVARDVPITHAWGGAVDRSHDGLPLFGTLPARVPLVYGGGFSGNGVAPSLLAGRILAALALGTTDEWSSCGLVEPEARTTGHGARTTGHGAGKTGRAPRPTGHGSPPGRFPPEPVRYLGGLLVHAAVAHKERREDAARRVDPLTRRLAALAPAGFSKTGVDGGH